jgi:hypothetical protein
MSVNWKVAVPVGFTIVGSRALAVGATAALAAGGPITVLGALGGLGVGTTVVLVADALDVTGSKKARRKAEAKRIKAKKAAKKARKAAALQAETPAA